MDLDDLVDKAKGLADDVPVEAVTDNLDELKDVATGDGAVADKAKGAFDIIREDA